MNTPRLFLYIPYWQEPIIERRGNKMLEDSDHLILDSKWRITTKKRSPLLVPMLLTTELCSSTKHPLLTLKRLLIPKSGIQSRRDGSAGVSINVSCSCLRTGSRNGPSYRSRDPFLVVILRVYKVFFLLYNIKSKIVFGFIILSTRFQKIKRNICIFLFLYSFYFVLFFCIFSWILFVS